MPPRSGLLVEHLTHGFWLDQTRIEKMAMGRPWRVTISCDGIGATHDKIRGKEHFFETVETTIQTLLRLRREHKLGYIIRLKTVIMEHNLHDVADDCALRPDPRPGGVLSAHRAELQHARGPDLVRAQRQLAQGSRAGRGRRAGADRAQAPGLADRQLRAPARGDDPLLPRSRAAADPHPEPQAHEKPLCSALTTIQIQSNGDVKSCWCMDPIGNIKETPIRQIWEEPSPLVGIGMLHGPADVGGRESLRGPDGRLLIRY